jgi:hypothetical protein
MSRKNPYGQLTITIRCGLAEAQTAPGEPLRPNLSWQAANKVVDWTATVDGYCDATFGVWLEITRFDQAELRAKCLRRGGWDRSDCLQEHAWHAVTGLHFNRTGFEGRIKEIIRSWRPDDDPMADDVLKLEQALAVIDQNLAGCDSDTVTDRASLEQELWNARRHLLLMERTNALARARSALTGVNELKELSRLRREGLAAIEAGCEQRYALSPAS